MVNREELRQRIWPADTFVDFDGGVNNAVKRLREALGDKAETPRFIETPAPTRVSFHWDSQWEHPSHLCQ